MVISNIGSRGAGGTRATKLDVGAETLCNISTHVRTNSSDMYATKKHSPRHE